MVDLTHGGVTIALELKRESDRVLAWDIYGTLGEDDLKLLTNNGIELVTGPDTGSPVIAPVHCPLERTDMTHHEITGRLLESWKRSAKIPLVEVTGVKGKTSTVWILREILRDLQPLILSSLGSYAGDDLLKRDISITPANMIETVRLAGECDCRTAIFEVSLGGTGLADVGVLTNIAEDYPIRQGTSSASRAKSQIFRSRRVCCEYGAFRRYYDRFWDITNTFSVTDDRACVHASDVEYGLESTSATLIIDGLETLKGDVIETEFSVETFAPAEHHLQNVLAGVSAALTLGKDPERIQEGLRNFRGIPGRTSIREFNGTTIIEEINPGLNVRAVEYSLEMVEKLTDPVVIIGGRYGVTCEEIDEERLIRTLKGSDLQFIFVDELGYSLMKGMGTDAVYFRRPEDALRIAMKHDTVLMIYRSVYGDLTRR